MDTNTTMSDFTSSAGTQQQASGRSIFWGLATLVISATLQPSFMGQYWSDKIFRDSLWPHRSLPSVCLLDGAVDIWLVVDKFRRPEVYESDDKKRARPTTVAMRLAIFVLGVLPQAIKLFSMRGIPATQALAAIFLISTVASTVRTLHVKEPYEDLDKLADKLKDKETSGPSPGFLRITMAICGLIFHLIAMQYAWSAIRGQAPSHFMRSFHPHATTEDAVDAVLWARWALEISYTLWGIYVLQHFGCMLVLGKWLVPRSPIIFILGLTKDGLVDLFIPVPPECPRRDMLMRTAQTIFYAALCSYAIALIFESCAKKLLYWSAINKSADSATADPPPAHAVGTDRLDSESGTSSADPATDPPPYYTSTADTPDGEIGVVSGHPVPAPTRSYSEDTTASTQERQAPETQEPRDATTTTAAGVSPTAEPIYNRAPSPTITSAATPETGNAEVSDSTSTPETTTGSSDTSGDESIRGRVITWMFCGVMIPLLLVLVFAGVVDLGNDADDERQDAAERGVADTASAQQQATASDDQSPATTSPPSTSSPGETRPEPARRNMGEAVLAHWFGQYAAKPLHLLIRAICLLIWRIYLGLMSLYAYSWNWMMAKLKPHLKDRMWVALGILNFATAAIYYLVIFDGKGTYTPGWASFLG